MYIHYYIIPDLRHEYDNYMSLSKNCVTAITNKVIQCAPLITALIAAGTLFSLFNQIEARYIPNPGIETTPSIFVPNDIKVVPIGKAIWIFQKKTRSFCGLSNPWCMKGYRL